MKMLREILDRLLGLLGLPSTRQCDALHEVWTLGWGVGRPIGRYCCRSRFHYGPHRDHDGRQWQPFRRWDE